MRFNLDKMKVEITGDKYNRQLTFFVSKKDFKTRRKPLKIIRELIKINEQFANYDIKVDFLENVKGPRKLEFINDVLFLNNKRDKENKHFKTIAKLYSIEREFKTKVKRTGQDLFIYNMVFGLPDKFYSFDVTWLSNKEINIKSTFDKDKYYLLEGTLEFDKYKAEKQKGIKREIGFKPYNFKLSKDYQAKAVDYDAESLIEECDVARSILHSHTLFSKNDAFINYDQVMEGFEKGVLKSFAITDHREARGFLDAQRKFKGTDHKVIPGLEAEVFDDLDPSFNYETDIHSCPRYHMVLLLSAEDSYTEYKGAKVKVNEGYRALNKLISDANLKYYSEPTKEFREQQETDGEWKSSKKPIMSLKQILEFKKLGLLKIGSACIAGTIRKHWLQGDLKNFRKYFDIVDWVEIHPMHNERFIIDSKIFLTINSEEDIKAKNRELVEYCKNNNKPFIFGDDAHIFTKKHRFIRKWFKMGEIAKFSKLVKKDILEKLDTEKQKQNIKEFYEENKLESQPFLHNFYEMEEELTSQGFSQDDIDLFLKNEHSIADQCVSIQDITLIPKVMIIPDFPGIDVTKEVPKLAWEFAVNKWSKDETINGIPQIIRDRLKMEIDAVGERNYEILYYFARFLVQESMKRGYIVGSRGSVGSSLLAHCLEITENNPIMPHYFCPNCKTIEWREGKLSGLDFPDKPCKCGGTMHGDGLNIRFSSFLGYNHDKVPDIDLNFSSDDLESNNPIQAQVIEALRKLFPNITHSVRSGTFSTASSDGLVTKVLSKIPLIAEHVANEEFDLRGLAQTMEGVYVNSGQHPGGVLVLDPKRFDSHYCFAMNYVGEYGKKTTVTNSLDYHPIEDFVLKLDILGKKDPALLKPLMELTGTTDFMLKRMKYNDPKVYKAMTDLSTILPNPEDIEKLYYKAGTMGIPELGTKFIRRAIELCQPKNFTDFIDLEGLTHGTQVLELAKPFIESGQYSIDEIPWGTRDKLFYYFTKIYGADPTKSFQAIEFIRKGKWQKAPADLKKYIKSVLPKWVYDSVIKIIYLFPTSHAASYFMMAYRMMYYKVYHPGYFFAIALTSISQNVPSFDYERAAKITDKAGLEHFKKYFIDRTKNKDVVADCDYMADLIFEAKLFGFSLEMATIVSHHKLFTYDKETNIIQLPLTSINGISNDAIYIREIVKISGGDFSKITLEELTRIQVQGIGGNGNVVMKRLSPKYVKALKLEEYYIKNGYELTLQKKLF